MSKDLISIRELHWMMDVFQSIDVGLVVLDTDLKVVVWNCFMANHSGRKPEQVTGKKLSGIFPDLPEAWLKRKTDAVFLLKNRAFTTWEQHPYLFKFKNYRPITGASEFMYQNVTFIPLTSADGTVNHVGIIVYDVTDIATNKNQLEEANKKLEALSRTDRLTGLANRAHWEECLHNEHLRYLRTKQTSSLIMLDIDHFKNVNDSYGHQTGDEVIRQTARIIRESIRKTDLAGRYGGEEFAIILVDTPSNKAQTFAERLRARVEMSPVVHNDLRLSYTISLGIAEASPAFGSHQQWIEAADQALYESKHQGRNRLTIFSPP